MRSRGYGATYNGRSRNNRGSSGSRSRPSSSSGYSNTHVNALLLQARRRAYIGSSIGRYGNGAKHNKGTISRGNNQRGALVRNRYGQYRLESNAGNFGIKGHRQAVKSKLRPSTSGAPYQTNTLRRAQSAGRTRSNNQPVYWGASAGKAAKGGAVQHKQQQAYYPGGASKNRRPQSAGAVRKTSGPVMATKQFYGANSLAKNVTTKIR